MKIAIKKKGINVAYRPYLFDDTRYQHFYGGSNCFGANTLVYTNKGKIPIQNIKKGDYVLSVDKDKTRYKKVTDTFVNRTNTKKIRLTLRDGTSIIVTENHRFFYEGKYQTIKDILENHTKLLKVCGKQHRIN